MTNVSQYTIHSENINNMISDLSKELNSEKSLNIIENTLWSLKVTITEDDSIDNDTKKEYEELFNILINRYERLCNILKVGFTPS